MLNHLFDLQLFAEGGDGGAAGEGAGIASGVSDNDEAVNIPSSIPERARKTYLKAVQKTRSASVNDKGESGPQGQSTDDPIVTQEAQQKKPSFSELIEDESYKAEREAYMHKAFSKRFSKYQGIEEENVRAKSLLSQMAERYGVDPSSKTFFDDLEKAHGKDSTESRVRELSEKYDMDPEEARRIADSESKLAESERQKKAEEFAKKELEKRAEQERLAKQFQESANKTKEIYPEFDIRECLKDERFMRICAATGGDTTAAYAATYHEKIRSDAAKAAATKAKEQVANAIAANRSRPVENGLGSVAPSVTNTDYSRMSLKELRAAAAEMRKKSRM